MASTTNLGLHINPMYIWIPNSIAWTHSREFLSDSNKDCASGPFIPPWSRILRFLATQGGFSLSPLCVCVCVCVCVWVAQSCPTLVTSWTVAHQVSLSMEFPKQEYWSGFPFPSPGDLPNPETEPGSPHSRQILYNPSHQARGLSPLPKSN